VTRADDALLEALGALQRALEASGRPAMIIGGLAVIARGVPRQTVDIDATVAADGLDVEAFLRVLGEQGIVPRIEHALEFARERQVLLLRHDPTGTPLEISLAWLPFELDALARATVISFGGVRVRMATAEDLVVYKAVAWRDRDRADIERLLLIDEHVDIERVRTLVKQFAEALDEPERLAGFDAIVARVRNLRLRP
jgi:hypothetical protein